MTAIPDLVRWYSADTLGLADNALVATWPDRSGSGADLTAAGADRPIFCQSRWNGKPAVVFSGSQRLASTSLAAQPASDVTVFAVWSNFKHGATSPRMLSWGNGGAFGVDMGGNGSVDPDAKPPFFMLKRTGGAFGDNIATATVLPRRADPIICTGIASGTTTKVRVDKGNEVTDSGDSGTIEYGTGTVTLVLGDKGAGAGLLQGEIYEVLIFARALTSTEIGIVEDYLDQKWRVTIAQASLVGLYNGESAAGNSYQIGMAWMPDGRRAKRHLSNPVFTKDGTGWERDLVKDPAVIWDGNEYVMFYSGWTTATSKFQIGRATSSDLITWTRDTHNPVIATGGSGAIDEGGSAFPTVIFDLTEPDETRRWKLWYSAIDGSGKQTIAYAHSTDGITWTKYGRVLDVGSAGAWDAFAVGPGAIYKDGSTWNLFYHGTATSSDPGRAQVGVATFTNPESTYTKYGSNPTIKARFNDSGTSQALTANLAAGGRTVTVADTSAFNVHEPVFLDRVSSSSSEPELNRVMTIDSSTQMTLEWKVVNAFPTSDSARIVPALYNGVGVRGIRKLADGTYELRVSPFKPSNDVAHSDQTLILREMSSRATLATLTSIAVYDYAPGLSMTIMDTGTWDELSAENFWPVQNYVPKQYLRLPFIASSSRVFDLFSLFTDLDGSGAGNAGELFGLELAANGASVTATLAAGISDTATLLELTGISGLPTVNPFILRIGTEQLYVAPIGGGFYRIRTRGMGNTTKAAHLAGATATWTDSYDMAVRDAAIVAASFSANIAGSGSASYGGWLVAVDATQAYNLAGSRYPMHVTSFVGVFPAGTGTGGTNRMDAAQPNAVATPTGISDDCPCAWSRPSRIASDIAAGDIAVLRYTNPEASDLLLGPRTRFLQSVYGVKGVDSSDADVTLTDATGRIVTDGTVNGVWDSPLGPGIAPDTGAATNHDVPYTSVTLAGSSRTFTHGGAPSPPNFAEKGFPFGVIAVRQGNRRVPFWRAYDWKDFNYGLCGFAPDATFAQVVINRNGMTGALSSITLPGPQDITGPDAVWDDGSYQFGASWGVVLFGSPFFVLGPTIGGSNVASVPSSDFYVPVVSFPTSPSSPVISTPSTPPVEGGSGGGIPAPTAGRQRSNAQLV